MPIWNPFIEAQEKISSRWWDNSKCGDFYLGKFVLYAAKMNSLGNIQHLALDTRCSGFSSHLWMNTFSREKTLQMPEAINSPLNFKTNLNSNNRCFLGMSAIPVWTNESPQCAFEITKILANFDHRQILWIFYWAFIACWTPIQRRQ